MANSSNTSPAIDSNEYPVQPKQPKPFKRSISDVIEPSEVDSKQSKTDSECDRVVMVGKDGKVSVQPHTRYNTLKQLKAALDGPLQGLPIKCENLDGELGEDVMVYCNEEGRLKNGQEDCPWVVRIPDQYSLL